MEALSRSQPAATAVAVHTDVDTALLEKASE
jgi:hypothetical protein